MHDFDFRYSGKIAAMVSGGVDSMVMLDLIKHCDVFVVHVNHHIRSEAEADCAFVQKYCATNNIRFVRFDFDIPALAKQNSRSIETEARLARKRVVSKLLNGSADKVAFAHHADDNAETVLMHILRGCGVDGLKGMEESDNILRPLLKWTRAQIVSYATEMGIPYVEDKTNYDINYTRNFIRHEVMPLIVSRYKGAVEALNRLALNATETVRAIDATLDMSLILQGSEVKLKLEALSSPFAARYIALAAKTLMPVDITRKHIQSVLKLGSSTSGSKVELANGLKVYKDYDVLTFRFDERVCLPCVPFALGETEVGDFIVSATPVDGIIRGKTVVKFPLPDGCVLRSRKEGDIFVPYGGKKKTLKKYLIDKKVPCRLRDSLVCLCKDNEVLAIVGLEISDKVKVSGGGILLEVRRGS